MIRKNFNVKKFPERLAEAEKRVRFLRILHNMLSDMTYRYEDIKDKKTRYCRFRETIASYPMAYTPATPKIIQEIEAQEDRKREEYPKILQEDMKNYISHYTFQGFDLELESLVRDFLISLTELEYLLVKEDENKIYQERIEILIKNFLDSYGIKFESRDYQSYDYKGIFYRLNPTIALSDLDARRSIINVLVTETFIFKNPFSTFKNIVDFAMNSNEWYEAQTLMSINKWCTHYGRDYEVVITSLKNSIRNTNRSSFMELNIQDDLRSNVDSSSSAVLKLTVSGDDFNVHTIIDYSNTDWSIAACSIQSINSSQFQIYGIKENVDSLLSIHGEMVYCNVCNKVKGVEGSIQQNRRRICADCVSGSMYQCIDCGDYNLNGHRCPCQTFEMRELSPSDSMVVPTEKGDIMKTLRLVGIELEYYRFRYSEKKFFIELNKPKRAFITRDGSVNGDAKEIVTMPRGGKDFEVLVNDILNVAESVEADSSCGYHIHIDTRDYKPRDIKNLFVSYLNIENSMFSLMPNNRKNNQYCYRLKNIYSHCYKTKIDDKIEKLKSFEGKKGDDGIIRTFYQGSQDRGKYNSLRYAWANFHSLFRDKNIEVRIHSGTANYDKIVHWASLQSAVVEYVKNYGIIEQTELKDILSELRSKDLITDETVTFYIQRSKKFNNNYQVASYEDDYTPTNYKKIINNFVEIKNQINLN